MMNTQIDIIIDETRDLGLVLNYPTLENSQGWYVNKMLDIDTMFKVIVDCIDHILRVTKHIQQKR